MGFYYDVKPKFSIEEFKKRLEVSFEAAINPYSAFSPKIEGEYKDKLIAAGFDPEDYPDTQEGLFDMLIDDLCDDYSNCGGMALHRMPDVINIYPVLSEEQQKEVMHFMVNWFLDELNNWEV